MHRFLTWLMAGVFLCSIAYAQDSDSPSLGDIARQARQQKQQKDAQAKGATAKTPTNSDTQNTSSTASAPSASAHVVTNEEIPEHAASIVSPSHHLASTNTGASDKTGDKEARGEQWRSEIQQQKSEIASLQQQIDSLRHSIQYAGANCVANCVKWNEHQEKKQEQADSMKSQLEEIQHHLEEMQETARKEGFGSSIYDP